MLYDIDSDTYFSSYQKWDYFSPEDDEFRKEFIPDDFFKLLCRQVHDLVKQHRVNPCDIVGISTACMRHSYVFMDKNHNEVYGGPNTDTRGLYYQDVVEEDIVVDLYNMTGQGPPLLYMPTRLLWFREEKPEIFDKIKYAVSTGDWLIYKLSGELVTEPSLASSTLLFDLKQGKWLVDVLEELDIENIELPLICASGERGGGLTNEAAKLMGLKSDTPVVIGGSDTQLGLLSCGAIGDGDIGVVAGTSIPVMMVVTKPIVDSKRRIWTGCHVVRNQWVLESNAQMGGLVYEWLKHNFQTILGQSNETVYRYMEQIAKAVPVGSDNVLASLGTEIFDINKFSVIRPSGFTFDQPVHPMNTTPASFAHFVRAALENICCSIRGNIEQLEEVSHKQTSTLKVTGGMSKNHLWLDILAHVTGKTISATSFEEGTSIGCIMCAAVGAEIYKDFDGAVRNIGKVKKEIVPNDETIASYDKIFNSWKTWYEKLAEV